MHAYDFNPVWDLPGTFPVKVPIKDMRDPELVRHAPTVGDAVVYRRPDGGYIFDCSTPMPDGCEFVVGYSTPRSITVKDGEVLHESGEPTLEDIAWADATAAP